MARDPASLINIPRLQAAMDAAGLDAVVVRSGHNFTYLSGVVYPGTLARHQDFADSDRAQILIWPRNGEPVIVGNAIANGLTARDSWVTKIESYEGYVESPYAKLAAVLEQAGLARGKVGFESRVISAGDWALVAGKLPTLSMVDCTKLMDGVRAVKTPLELAKLKAGADLLDEVYLKVFAGVAEGDSERKLHTRIIEGCLARGCGWAHGILNSNTNLIPYAGESDNCFWRGDVVRTDYVAYLDGYPGHQSRNAILGKATATQLSEYHRVRDIYRETIDACRPGVTAGEIHALVVKLFAKAGWDYRSMLVGHGVGSWWHQQAPILARGEPTVLEPGMVLALEPAKGYWHIQDMIVVNDGPPSLISDLFNTDDPFIVDL